MKNTSRIKDMKNGEDEFIEKYGNDIQNAIDEVVRVINKYVEDKSLKDRSSLIFSILASVVGGFAIQCVKKESYQVVLVNFIGMIMEHLKYIEITKEEK